ncbi:CesT family type III secretion system chaperone [Hyphomicrobium sp. MC1]|uniref:CesT family type III secretion system chaperone n=1 Tax=Hyphomicrobium sp. (strain MC1) TaxID=717785 RepID=UPI0012F4D90D|nr:CesT family type III secretion system chaperone [Hyphomicrobium sp. MC1]
MDGIQGAVEVCWYAQAYYWALTRLQMGCETAMPSSNFSSTVAHPSLERLLRLLRLQTDSGTGQALAFTVDGTTIRAEALNRFVRLSCRLGLPPSDELELRRLMRHFFRHADRGAEILCMDAEGQLVLVADVADDAEFGRLTALFCDAAVHWSALSSGMRTADVASSFLDQRPQMVIRP